MAVMHTQEFFVAATTSADVVLIGDPISLASATRGSLQLVHVSSDTGGSRFKVVLEKTKDGITWTSGSLSIDWTATPPHVAPATELNEDSSVVADAAACRIVVTQIATSAASVIRVTLRLQDVR